MSMPTANRQPPTDNRILLVLDLPSRGGAETQATYLAKGLVEKGMDVHILFFIPEEMEELERFRETGATVHITGFRSKLIIPPFKGLESKARALYYQFKLIFQLRKIKSDSIIPFTYPPNIILSRCWKWTKATKCFWNQRDEGRMFLGRDFEIKALNNTTAIISNSKEGQIFLQKYTHKPIQIIHNGVVFPDTLAKTDANGLIKVVMVANLHGYKDHLTLLKAWKLVVEQIRLNKATLILAGKEGSTAESIKTYISENYLSESVQLLGQVKNVNALLKDCHIGVFSSVKEGLPNGILECMAMGLPVVASHINGAVEALGEYYQYLVPEQNEKIFADYLLDLINESIQRKEVGALNRQRITNEFAINKMVNAYCKLIIV